MRWPKVVGELDTMRQVAAGASLARYGDGELKMIYGRSYVREQAQLALATELFQVLSKPRPGLLIGIPSMDKQGPKYPNWIRHADRFRPLLDLTRTYVSAFVTRPDSSPWILTQEYLEVVTSAWAGKRVVLVAEPTSKLWTVVRRRCAFLTCITCLTHGAYGTIDQLERDCLATKADIAVLSVGVTATCLAARLHAHGMHAVDLGSAGGFLARLMSDQAL